MLMLVPPATANAVLTTNLYIIVNGMVPAGTFGTGLAIGNSALSCFNSTKDRWRANSASWAGWTRKWNRYSHEVPMPVKNQAIVWTGSASLAEAAAVSAAGPGTFKGSGTLADTAAVAAPGVMKFSGSATLTPSDLISGTGHEGFHVTGVLATTPAVGAAGHAVFRGSATLSDSPNVSATGFVSFKVTGTLASSPAISASGHAALRGSATVSSSPSVSATAFVSFRVTGTLSATPVVGANGHAAFHGSATLNVGTGLGAGGSLTFHLSGPLIEVAGLSATAFPHYLGSGTVAAVAALAGSVSGTIGGTIAATPGISVYVEVEGRRTIIGRVEGRLTSGITTPGSLAAGSEGRLTSGATTPGPVAGQVGRTAKRGRPRVALRWNASLDAGASGFQGYNIYRSQPPLYVRTLITGVPIMALSYTDWNVTTGQTYRYEMTAVVNGVETAVPPSVDVTVSFPMFSGVTLARIP